jgi:hypothetical protein
MIVTDAKVLLSDVDPLAGSSRYRSGRRRFVVIADDM